MLSFRQRLVIPFFIVMVVSLIPAFRHIFVGQQISNSLVQALGDSSPDIASLNSARSSLDRAFRARQKGTAAIDSQEFRDSLLSFSTQIAIYQSLENRGRHGDELVDNIAAAARTVQEMLPKPVEDKTEMKKLDFQIMQMNALIGQAIQHEVGELETAIQQRLLAEEEVTFGTVSSIGIIALLTCVIAVMFSTSISGSLRRLSVRFEKSGITSEKSNRSHSPDEIEKLDQYFDDLNTRLANATKNIGATTSVIDSMKDAVLVIDSNGFIAKVNRSASHILGKSSEELSNSPFTDVEELSPFASSVNTFLTGVPFERQGIQLIDRSGNPLIVSVIASPIETAGGDICGCVIVVRDETAQRQLEYQLVEQKFLLESAERLAAVGTMGAIVAHKFSQPITSVRLLLQQVRKNLDSTECPDTVRESLADCLTELARASELVKYVVSNAKHGTYDKPERVNVKEAIDRTSLALSQRISRSHARLECAVSGTDEPTVWGPRIQVDEVLYTLINNSLQAAREGVSPVVKIEILSSAEAVSLAVTDNGSGISEEHLDHIFDCFYSTKSPDQGTGLGLAIVRQIVRELGGEIKVESVVNAGTTVRLNFVRKESGPVLTF